ncbi:MAG: histidinol-phosphatase [Bacteroidetes bacterium]|nr:histidinol-phosphatase [Fibrella sp.]
MSTACFWQTDIHSHLVPGIDDGVADFGQSLICLQQLAAWGIRHVITTPHVNRDWYPNTSATLRESRAGLQTLITENNLPLTIDVAAEYLLDDFFPQLLEADDLLTFGAERYLLIEIGWSSAPHFMEDILFRIQTKGYQPILAHPERYRYYHENMPGLAKLRETGCLFQLNWPSLTGQYGASVQKQARKLLELEWVDFIGSDIHRPASLDALSRLFASSDYKKLSQQPLRNQRLYPENSPQA